MNKVNGFDYDAPDKNNMEMYNKIKNYLFDLEQQDGNEVIDALRKLTRLSSDLENELSQKTVNLVQKAIDDYLFSKKESLNDIGYSLRTNIYKKSADSKNEWIWPSFYWCEIQLDNYTDCNGLCNVSFILDVPTIGSNDLFDVYIDDELFAANMRQNEVISIDIPMKTLEYRILKIVKKNKVFFQANGDDRKLYFSIKNFLIDFIKKNEVDISFGENYSQRKWNGDWIWSLYYCGEIEITNYSHDNGMIDCRILLDFPIASDTDTFDIYWDNQLIFEKVKAETYLQVEEPIGQVATKKLRIVKSSERYSMLANDERQLYFCIKQFDALFIPNNDVEYEFQTGFYDNCGDWKWAGATSGEISIYNCNNDSMTCSCGFFLEGVNDEKCTFDIFVDGEKIVDNIENNKKTFFMVPLKYLQHRKIKVVKSNSKYECVDGDDRKLYFCIKEFEIKCIPQKGIDVIYKDGFYETQDAWKWAGDSRGVISLFNFFDSYGTCIYSMTIDCLHEELSYFDVYVDNQLAKEHIACCEKVELSIPFCGEMEKRIQIVKSNDTYDSIDGDDRKLYFCIKEVETEFIPRNNVEIIFDDGFYDTVDEWHWASNNEAKITMRNYCKDSRLVELSLALGVLSDSEQPEFAIWDQEELLLCGINKNEATQINMYLNPGDKKEIRIKKDTNTYSTAENDDRKLFFCVHNFAVSEKRNEKFLVEYDEAFYGVEGDGQQTWNWSSKETANLEIYNLSPSKELCRMFFQMATVCTCPEICFSVYADNQVIAEKLTTGATNEVEFEIHANEKKQIRIESENIKLTKVPSDNRELYFTISNLTVCSKNSVPERAICDKAKEYSHIDVLEKRMKWKNIKNRKWGSIGGISSGGAYSANKEEMKKTIDCHEVISFDLFDTLLTRCVLYPEDVFEILEKRAQKIYGGFSDLAQVRKQVQSRIEHITLDEIYSEIGNYYNLDSLQICELKKLELSIEMDLLSPRKEVINMFEYAKKAGKSVYIVSDMYISKDDIENILYSKNIYGYEQILVSCDYKKTKREGLLSDLEKKEKNKSILHIGNNLDIDIYSAVSSNIDCYYIKSCVDMYKESAYAGELLGRARTCNERSILGMVLSELFNSPFLEDEIEVEKIIYCFFAPIISAFMLWLWKQANEKKYDGVLFAARDGYLFKELFTHMQQQFADESIDAIYFLTSRAAASSAGIRDKNKIMWLADVYKNMSLEEVLVNRFGFTKAAVSDMCNKGDSVMDFMNMHSDLFLAQAEILRKNYKEYVDKLKIKENGKYAFFDFVSSGTCQLLLSSIMNDVSIEGMYFCKNYAGDAERQNLTIHSFMQNNDLDNANTFFFSVYKCFELFITSTMPALLYFSEEGKPIYDTEKRSKEQIELIEKIHSIIKSFFTEFINTLYIENDVICAEFADSILGMYEQHMSSKNVFANNQLALVDDWINNLIFFD